MAAGGEKCFEQVNWLGTAVLWLKIEVEQEKNLIV